MKSSFSLEPNNVIISFIFKGYPYTRNHILREAKIDISPLLRGEIWLALLNVRGDYMNEYMRIDKNTRTTTDRQVNILFLF